MNILLFVFEIYFALQLVVSGLAKAENRSYFEFTLRQHKVMPTQITTVFSRLFPIFEIFLGFLLLISYGVWAIYIAIVNLLLFFSFLIYKIFLAFNKPNSDCGCSGTSSQKTIDSISLISSTILVLFAVITFWLTTWVESVAWEVKGITISLLVLMIAWVLIRLNLKKRAYKHDTPNTI
jgi:Methylamine utilisation protein MauE